MGAKLRTALFKVAEKYTVFNENPWNSVCPRDGLRVRLLDGLQRLRAVELREQLRELRARQRRARLLAAQRRAREVRLLPLPARPRGSTRISRSER